MLAAVSDQATAVLQLVHHMPGAGSAAAAAAAAPASASSCSLCMQCVSASYTAAAAMVATGVNCGEYSASRQSASICKSQLSEDMAVLAV
jgi:hypothetical protein